MSERKNKNSYLEKTNFSLTRIENQLSIVNKIISNSYTEKRKEFWRTRFLSPLQLQLKAKAFWLATQCIKEFPTWELGWWARGLLQMEQKNYVGMYDDFLKSIGCGTKRGDPYFYVSNYLYEKGKIKEAILVMDQALSLPENEWGSSTNMLRICYELRASLKDELSDYEGAIEDYSKVIELDSVNTNAYIKRAYYKYDIGNYIGAIEDYTKVIELDGECVDAYFNRALSKGLLGDHLGAIEDHTKAIELNNQYNEAYIFRAMEKRKLRDFYGAIDDLTKAIELNNEDAFAYNQRSITKFESGDIEEAYKDLKKFNELKGRQS